ncbi:DUF2637 domain-containing protein [Amycolatopsis sp.]|uniref:DUF2637 domain-containing protein n=1 Tax=Amycolatopsis sp. TaxID=37632 RepID=UPI002CB3EE90|nr:DUF2637 domain-containing protein [Amycolatopsis sp.]HVV09236.1 DUF2637 domain-containing protein [Amycolatopsis sp.]
MSTTDIRPRRRPSLTEVIRLAVTIILGGIGAAAGFTHTHDWAVHNGQAGWLAWADAVVIEGMAIVAGFELHRDHHNANRRRISFPAVVLVAGITIQMAAQVALAPRTPAGWLLAAMPALGFLVVVKLLMRRAPTDTPDTTPAAAEATSEPVPTPAQPEPVAPEIRRPNPQPPSPAEGTAVLPRVKLPAPMAERVHALAAEIRHAGRDVTPADIQRVVKVPDDLAARIVADLAPAIA